MVTVVIGAQWGDEGKGKIIDLLAQKADFVVRFHGGPNAGHTIVNNYGKFPLHLMPSGVFNPKCACIIANGVVIDLEILQGEIVMISKIFPDLETRFFVSPRAHVILPYHKQLDKVFEEAKGKGKTGTTGRGIGPVYADKAAYLGIRIDDFLRPNILKTKIEINLRLKNPQLRAFGYDTFSTEPLIRQQTDIFQTVKPFVRETYNLLQSALNKKQKILFEGAQGVFLDNDWGTYPYVTASHTVTGSVTIGAGIAPSRLKEIIAVTKAYTTRVGSGPFPTEQNNKIGQKLRAIGNEFGATTGRPSRCGWLDLELLRFKAQMNGVTGWAVTKLDVLDTFSNIKVCTDYLIKGKKVNYSELDAIGLSQVKPVYKTFPGWRVQIKEVKKFTDLPRAAKYYLAYIEKETGIPIKLISIGAEREKTIRK